MMKDQDYTLNNDFRDDFEGNSEDDLDELLDEVRSFLDPYALEDFDSAGSDASAETSEDVFELETMPEAEIKFADEDFPELTYAAQPGIEIPDDMLPKPVHEDGTESEAAEPFDLFGNAATVSNNAEETEQKDSTFRKADEIAPEKSDARETFPEKSDSGFPNGRKAKNKKKKRFVLSAVFVLLAVLAGFGIKMVPEAKVLLSLEKTIKSDIRSLASSAKKLDLEQAYQTAVTVDEEVGEACDIMNSASWRALRALPAVGRDVKGVAELLNVAKKGTEELLLPALDRVKGLPVNELKKPDSGNVGSLAEAATALLDMTETMLPTAEELMDRLAVIPPMHISKIEEKMGEIREISVLAGAVFPVLEGDMMDYLRVELVPELCELLAVYPPSSISEGELSYNLHAINAYLDLLKKTMPKLEEGVEELRRESSQLPANLSEYAEQLSGKVEQVASLYHAAEKYLPLLSFYVDADTDRDYLLAAQNSAEIRAMGGFPGSMAVVTVRDGILTIGKFRSVYAVLPGDGIPEPNEQHIFGTMASANRDAGVDPHLPTVAKRWAIAYEYYNKTRLDGVICMTPAIIADLLDVSGEVTLLDGTVVNSENALRYLQNELYIKYLGRRSAANSALTDRIFADAAVQIVKGALDDPNLDKLTMLIQIIEKRSKDRVIMLWLADEEGEECIRSLGMDGGFNTDPANPQLGIYFNNYPASKLGWYLDIDPVIGEGTHNEDGSVTYPVTVTVRNTMTREEVGRAGFYILKETAGCMRANLVVVAPAGGSFSDVKKANVGNLNAGEFAGSSLLYTTDFRLGPLKELTVSFSVTTAPGEQAPMTFVTTPTLTEYR